MTTKRKIYIKKPKSKRSKLSRVEGPFYPALSFCRKERKTVYVAYRFADQAPVAVRDNGEHVVVTWGAKILGVATTFRKAEDILFKHYFDSESSTFEDYGTVLRFALKV